MLLARQGRIFYHLSDSFVHCIYMDEDKELEEEEEEKDPEDPDLDDDDDDEASDEFAGMDE